MTGLIEVTVDGAVATPWSAASRCVERGRPTVLFETQDLVSEPAGRSLLCSGPSTWLREVDGEFVEFPSRQGVDDPLGWIRRQHRSIDSSRGGMWCGGLAGFLGFEFGWYLDDVGGSAKSATTPNLWVGRFDAGAVYDHGEQTWTVVGRDEESVADVNAVIDSAGSGDAFGEARGQRQRQRDVSRRDYQGGVRAAVEAIYEGDFFETNYTERFSGRWQGDRRALYDGLRSRAPGRFGGIVDVDGFFIASVSPEQFLSVAADGTVTTRPIKGTRPRGETSKEDRRFARELVSSRKDRAENVMIVDLMRNDLTKVCAPGSVHVTELCELHSFRSVHHLVSTVQGELGDDFDALDVFTSSFPAGSITGAPKLRVMQWIAEHEHRARGPYTGSMFYWSDHGRLDSNVLIRSAVLGDDGALEYGSGGAVVADSDPDGEYEEALWKAAPFFELLET